MKVVLFDTTYLSLLLHEGCKAPIDETTGACVERAKERIEHLVSTLERERAKIIIPTPALCEFLVVAENSQKSLDIITGSAWFEVYDFNQLAAVECAVLIRQILSRVDKKTKEEVSRAKLKFDRQIFAIAKVRGVDTIYSDDKEIINLAKANGIEAVKVCELPLPPPRQSEMFEESEVAEEPTPSSPPSEPSQLVEQSDGDGKEKAEPPLPSRPSAPRAAPEPPQPDSSPPQSRPVRSEPPAD